MAEQMKSLDELRNFGDRLQRALDGLPEPPPEPPEQGHCPMADKYIDLTEDRAVHMEKCADELVAKAEAYRERVRAATKKMRTEANMAAEQLRAHVTRSNALEADFNAAVERYEADIKKFSET